MRRGFTLTEILVVIVILAVMASIAIPGFSREKLKHDALQAVTYLRAVRLAEKMYFAKNATYLLCAVDSANNPLGLGTEVTTGTYHFDVVAGGAGIATSFIARARRGAAPANCTDANTLCVDQNGTWTGNSAYLPAF